jgi:hypothetical protein
MSKHASKEAFFQRLQELAEVKKPLIKVSRNLGTLIDYKRAADGVAYGIVKEQHHYYIKKAGTKQDPNVADFAYIGGLENIKEYQYGKLSEADKQRNMIFRTINEAVTTKVSKTGSKRKLNEDKAGEEIEKATEKVGSLDAATDAAATPEMPAPEGGGEAEMAAGLDAEPAPAGDVAPAPAGDELPAGDEPSAIPAEEPATDEVPAEEPATDEIPAEEKPEGGEPEVGEETEIDKMLGKLTNVIRKSQLEPTETKSYLNTFVSSFKDKLREVDIEDRKEIANKILKVVTDDEIEDVSASVPQNDEPEAGVEEEACAECGGFGKYAESRGYNSPDAFMECDDEEKASVLSGYANANGEGQNDGDFKLVALLVNPEIIEKLKGDYGHDEYSEKLTPYTNELSEATEEDKLAQINELWGGLGSLGKAAWGGIKKGAQAGAEKIGQAASAVKGAVQKGAEKVGQAATAVKQTYHTGEVPGEIKKLEGIAQDLGKQIAALNTRLQKAGKQPVNVQSILTTIKNQVGAGGAASLGKYGVAAEGITDPANVEVQPTMLKEDDEPEEEIEKTDVELNEPEGGGIEAGEVDDTKDGAIGAGALGFAPTQSLGSGVVKPEGAGVEIQITPDKAVNIQMNESEKKLRKYIRERLEVKAGLRKPSLNESKKSVTLKKLDTIIDEQFKLYESVVLKKKVNEEVVSEIFGLSVKEKFAKLDPNDQAGVDELFKAAFKNILINPHMSNIGAAANRLSTPEKYNLVKQFVEGGGGTLRLDKAGKPVYMSKQYQNTGIQTPQSGGSTGLRGI